MLTLDRMVCGSKKVYLNFLDCIYTLQVFASNSMLLLWFGLPVTWQWHADAPETFETKFQSEIFWNHNLLSHCVNQQNMKPVKAVTTLMLMLMLA